MAEPKACVLFPRGFSTQGNVPMSPFSKFVRLRATVVINAVPPTEGVPFKAIENDLRVGLKAPDAVLKSTPCPLTSAVAFPRAISSSVRTPSSLVQESIMTRSEAIKEKQIFMAIIQFDLCNNE
jgi:hypothetical protein